MTYTIEQFWKPLLSGNQPLGLSPPLGWSASNSPLESFVEAPLELSAQLSEGAEPANSQIILVSAPGAVGKSTLARQIAAVTGAVYIDLAVADPVGANTLSGGLAKSGLFTGWSNDQTTVLIDGLDEARIRVTQEAFEAFLSDIISLCSNRSMPIVLFGRTGSVQDAWLVLEGDVRTSVLEIGYYDKVKAIEFTYAKLRGLKNGTQHETVEKEAIELLLNKLRAQTEGDGDTFSGYAPVLQAVAERVSLEDNPSALIAAVERGEEAVTLQTVVDAIIDRERKKLLALPFNDTALLDSLYQKNEQLDHLVARVFGTDRPVVPIMDAQDAQRYDTALTTWVPEHPFLDGKNRPSSAVFEAIIIVAALRNRATEANAIASQIARGAAANPFLADFYQQERGEAAKTFVPSGHIGILYASLRSRLAIGESASLLVEANSDGGDEEALKAEVEITLTKRDFETTQTIVFDTDQTGVLRLGSHIEDVEVTAPLAVVEIGPAPEVTLVAPVSIECAHLTISANKLVAEPNIAQDTATVSLIADAYDGNISSVPSVRGKTSLTATWPNAKNHPWTSFAAELLPTQNEKVEEGLRRFRKFVIAFRSHSKGDLARLQAKIDHERMTKGAGQAVLDLLKARGIIYPVKSMYYLDPDKLGSETGATYAECMARQFKPKTAAFVNEALE